MFEFWDNFSSVSAAYHLAEANRVQHEVGQLEGLTRGVAEMASPFRSYAAISLRPSGEIVLCVSRAIVRCCGQWNVAGSVGGLHTNFGTVDVFLIGKQLLISFHVTV